MVGKLRERGYEEQDIELSLTELEQSEVIFSSGETFVRKAEASGAELPSATGRPQRDEPVQSGLRLLLRVQRGQD